MTSNRPQPQKRWGPAHQTQPKNQAGVRLLTGVAFVMLYGGTGSAVWSIAVIAAAFLIRWFVIAWREETAKEHRASNRIANAPDPLAAVLTETNRRGGGVYLGAGPDGDWVTARAERAVLLLGPPRSGKTTGVIIPAVLAHAGPVVCASTKPDVLAATAAARSRLGTVWQFDPTGTHHAPGAVELRWSPVTAARSWDGALMIARAMVLGGSVGAGTTDQTHWSRRAQALLAPLFHAAALGGKGVDAVVGWVFSHELDEPGVLLHNAGAELAVRVLVGLVNTEERERSSIFSAAADALDAYTSQGALAAASDPNFDPSLFPRTTDTVYIHAPAEHQALAAPLVCGLLSEIRQATYHAYRDLTPPERMLFALDEVANIAPLADLPQIASEGGGQGLTLVACFQDLSQARARWGPAADGFLTLFGSKLILPGVADTATLEAISLALGEYDRRVVSTTRTPQRDSFVPTTSRTVTTQRQRVLSPGDVANIPAGHALYLDGLNWQLLTLARAYRDDPWRTLTQLRHVRLLESAGGTVR
jgi:type IV secretory pathway TraG/TraD family ATPase VirD4